VTGRDEVVILVAADRHRLLGEEERLAALGYEAVGFASAEAAKQACLSSQERFDFVPVGQLGSLAQTFELTTELRQILPAAPIVLAARMTPELGTETLVKTW
jgi:hypothetical protein